MNLAHEHACLLRRLAALQARVSDQISVLVREREAACARSEAAERANRQLQSALMRERARALVAATRACWGLGGPMLANPQQPPHDQRSTPMTVTEVLCQTACQGHAHPWLTEDERCRLTGADCTRTLGAMVSKAPGAV